MNIFLTILFGFVAGVIGGMGMGGGTFLIPLFRFLNYEQKIIQAMNLISFLPMAIVALLFHFKNKLVETDGILWIVVPAIVFSVAGALLTNLASAELLKICFGIFFVLMGGWEMFQSIKKIVSDKKKKDGGT